MKTYNRKRKLEVGHLSVTWFTFAPGVIAAAGNLEYLTHQLDGIPAAMVMDKLKSQLLVRAMPVLSTAEVMMAVAFFKISFSSCAPEILCAAGPVRHHGLPFGSDRGTLALDRRPVPDASGTGCSC